MPSFGSQHAYLGFAHSVSTERRYLHTPQASDFLAAVAASARRREEMMPGGAFLWRAQNGAASVELSIGEDTMVNEDCPYPIGRMKPLLGRAREGRANPKGIPYLYLATERDTAVAEVRPAKGGVVTVAQFRATRELRLVNTTLDHSRFIPFREATPNECEDAAWGAIGRAYSEPTERSDDQSEYVPTQILAELLRNEGFDGVAYASSFGRGHNVMIFEPALMQQMNGFLVRVTDVSFTLELDPQHSYTVASADVGA